MRGSARQCLLVALLFSAGCASPSVWERMSATSWVLVSIEGEPVVEGSRVVLGVEGDSRLFGQGGVNRYFGTYEHEGELGFRAGRIAATHMSGPHALVKQEQRFLELLELADSVRIVESPSRENGGPRLELASRGQTVLTFVPDR